MRYSVLALLLAACFAQQSQEVRRPTTDINGGAIVGCTGTPFGSPAMPKAYDAAGLTTSSLITAEGNDTSAVREARIFSGWSVSPNSYTALDLKINASFSPDAGGSGCLKYSIDGATTFTTIQCSSAIVPVQTFTVSLSATQDFSKLRVGVCVSGTKGNSRFGIDPGFGLINISDIWTSGTNPAPASGNGSTAGQPHRAVVVTN